MTGRNAPRPKNQVTLGSRGQVTIPREIRERAQLEPGDPLEVDIVPGGILLRTQGAIERSEESTEEQEAEAGYDHLPKTDRDFFDSLEL